VTLRVRCLQDGRSAGTDSSRPAGLRRSRDDEGFTIIEVLAATVVFAILATAFAATLSASLRSFAASKARTKAEQIASSELEEAHRLAYADLGTVGGNPPGVLPATRTVADGGRQLQVATRVSYVNDPVPSHGQTGADYKSVRVTVTLVGSPTVLAQMSTLVAPPAAPSLSKGQIKAQVVDYALNQPVAGATVTLGSGPDAPRSDVTDADGQVSFAALAPTAASGTTSKYTLTASATGYQTLPEDLPPAPSASSALAASAVYSTVLRVFRPATITVHLVDVTGAPFTAAAEISISSSRGAGTFAATGADTVITSVAGEALIPSVSYTIGATGTGVVAASSTVVVPGDSPANPVGDVTLVMQSTASGQIEVHVQSILGTPIVGAAVEVTGGPAAIALAGVTNTSGVATITVPAGETPSYTVVVPSRLGFLQATGTIAGPGAGGIVTLTITVLAV
jgi:prepilin-type N-terminal cleavage/methylation domain-containing protein